MATATDVRQLYRATWEPALVDVPPLLFLTIDGRGRPGDSPVFEAAVQALFGVSYELRFAARRELGVEHEVGPLEALWWTPREAWEWTLMIRQPDELAEELFGEAVAAKQLAAASLLRLERLEEGLSAQVLHVGPYDAEGPALGRLHAFVVAHGYVPRARHHEIYLGDPRRTATARLRTILRQPVELRGGVSVL